MYPPREPPIAPKKRRLPSFEPEPCLEMGLSGFQAGRGVGRKLIQNGPLNPEKKWGAKCPTIFFMSFACVGGGGLNSP